MCGSRRGKSLVCARDHEGQRSRVGDMQKGMENEREREKNRRDAEKQDSGNSRNE